MRNFLSIRMFALMAIMGLVAFDASAQQYQKAKETLRASAKMDTFLFQSASAASKKIIQLPRGSSVLIYGKKGSFFDVKYQNLRGWAVTAAFTIQKPTAPIPEPTPAPMPSPIVRQQAPVESPVSESRSVSTSRDDGEFTHYRINPYMSFAMKGKDFDKQLRGGISASYAFSKKLALGAVADLVLLKGKYLGLGPILRTQWIDDSAFFNPAFYVGALYYSFDHDGVTDEGLGIQWAFENDIPIMRDNDWQPAITMKVGADLMYFYFDQVRIPFFIALGATLRF